MKTIDLSKEMCGYNAPHYHIARDPEHYSLVDALAASEEYIRRAAARRQARGLPAGVVRHEGAAYSLVEA